MRSYRGFFRLDSQSSAIVEWGVSLHSRPFPDLGDAHTAVRQPAHRHSVQSRSHVQARPESVAALLVYADALDLEVLTDLQPVDSVGDLTVLTRLLDARSEVCVLHSDAAPVP